MDFVEKMKAILSLPDHEQFFESTVRYNIGNNGNGLDGGRSVETL